MDGKIFVGLSPRDPVEEIIPYLERLAKPGMTVVCLVRYPVERRDYLRDHWVTLIRPDLRLWREENSWAAIPGTLKSGWPKKNWQPLAARCEREQSR